MIAEWPRTTFVGSLLFNAALAFSLGGVAVFGRQPNAHTPVVVKPTIHIKASDSPEIEYSCRDAQGYSNNRKSAWKLLPISRNIDLPDAPGKAKADVAFAPCQVFDLRESYSKAALSFTDMLTSHRYDTAATSSTAHYVISPGGNIPGGTKEGDVLEGVILMQPAIDERPLIVAARPGTLKFNGIFGMVFPYATLVEFRLK